MNILGKPPAPQAGDRFDRDGRLIGLLILLPGACPQFSQVIRIIMMGPPAICWAEYDQQPDGAKA